jgi:hypothetical protein
MKSVVRLLCVVALFVCGCEGTITRGPVDGGLVELSVVGEIKGGNTLMRMIDRETGVACYLVGTGLTHISCARASYLPRGQNEARAE